LAESGAKAQALIMAGRVMAPGLFKSLKAGLQVSDDQPLEITEELKYVSRGGEKLAGALDVLGVNPADRDCWDIGASTGGFTDCLLQRGAARVFDLDVGFGQLHWKLRKDPRVILQEKTHVLKLLRGAAPFAPSLVVMDVSFISLERVLPHLAAITDLGTEFVVLVKPQFEVEPKFAPKGIVRDPAAREAAIRKIADRLEAWGFGAKDDCPSPLPGAEGNIEHFLHFVRMATCP